LQAAGQISGGNRQADSFQGQQQMAYYQAQVARNNAIIADQQAEHEVQVGSERAARTSRAGAARLAGLETTQGASGVDMNTGSNKNVQVSQRELNKLDTETVLSDAQSRAYGYRVQGQNFRSQAGLYEFQGGRFGAAAGYAPTAGYLGAAGTLLSGASALPLKWGGGGGGGTPAKDPFGQTTGGGGGYTGTTAYEGGDYAGVV
jgi:hypothetical protein